MVKIPDNIVRMIKHPDTCKAMTTVSPEGEPHMIVCGSLTLTDDDCIVVGEVYMYRTAENLSRNPFAEFMVWKGREAYSLKTRATRRLMSGPEFDKINATLDKMRMEAASVWVFEVDEIWDEGISDTTGRRLV